MVKKISPIAVIAVFSTIFFLSIVPSQPLKATPNRIQHPSLFVHQAFNNILFKAQMNGSVDIIVGLRVSFQPEGLLSPQNIQSQRNSITGVRSQLLNSLTSYQPIVVSLSDNWIIPYIALSVNEATLEYLRSSPLVSSIEENVRMFPAVVNENISVVGANTAWNMGYDGGTGQTVAILDTGVDVGHPDMEGRVVYEACYSDNDPTKFHTSLCNNGQSFQEGFGAASPYSSACSTECYHGTHVASIAAGSSGTAKESKVIAIQVFTKSYRADDCNPGSPPCITSFASDQISALQSVYSLRSNFQVAAVNLSLGGGHFGIHCDTIANDITNGQVSYKVAVDLLRSVGIATIAASGNNNYSDGIAFPACLSTIVSVGATTNSDQVATPFPDYPPDIGSNSVAILDLLAPGSHVCAALPINFTPGSNGEVVCNGATSGHYGTLSGTSMAAPHVAGAWAILKQRYPQATVDQILAALQSSGIPIKDDRNNLITKRIRINRALYFLPAPVGCFPDAQIVRIARGEGANSPSISTDGRYIAFQSYQYDLNRTDVVLYDRLTCLTARVSVATDGSESNASSYRPAISADGRHIVFSSFATNLANVPFSPDPYIYIHDHHTGRTTLTSISANGSIFFSRYGPDTSISGNGTYVGFGAKIDEFDHYQIYVRNVQTQQTMLASVGQNGEHGNGDTHYPVLSAGGNHVAFESLASNLTSNYVQCVGYLCWQVFVRNLSTGQTQLVSISSDGTQGDSYSTSPSLSSDGGVVAFASAACNLIPGDNIQCTIGHIFVRDLRNDHIERVSVSFDSSIVNGSSEYPDISGDGRYVAYTSMASNIVSNDNACANGVPCRDIFIFDRQTKQTIRVSISPTREQPNGEAGSPALSADGRYVAFYSSATNLIPSDTNPSPGIYLTRVNFPPPSPENAAPTHNYFTTPTPTLTWGRVTWATRYEVQVANNNGFVGANTYQAGNNLELTLPTPLSKGIYFWHVRACSSQTSCGAWSAFDSFVIDVP